MTDLSDGCLMMIEPAGPATAPVEDGLTRLARDVLLHADGGRARYRGFHVCVCGAASDNLDHFLPGGVRTNSLLAHYVACHRGEVPEGELTKLRAAGRALRLYGQEK